MTIPETYLQTSWGDTYDDVTLDDIQSAISEITEMTEEPGVFWVGIFVGDSEIILESHADLTVVGIFNDDEEEELKAQFESWSEIENLYGLFLAKDFHQVKSILNAK
jgi:hypothetical protein